MADPLARGKSPFPSPSPSTPLPFVPIGSSVTDTPRDPDPYRILDELDSLQRSLSGAQRQIDRSEQLETLGTLAGMIAHEVRNIASKIVGAAQLADRNAEDPVRVRELSERIVRLGLHAGRVAETILAAADEPIPGDCLLIEVHRRAMDALPSEARARFDDAGLPADLRAAIDPDALERVLVNLYLNAWRAVGGSGGDGRVTISAKPPRCRSEHGCPRSACSARNIQISVRDDGPGIHPEVAETVFQPWRRGDGEARHGGHGLGLALCRHLIEAAGGSIRFAPPAGQGAEVIAEIPAFGPSEHARVA